MIILYIIASLLAFWTLYLAVMNLYKAYQVKTIPKNILPLAYCILALGAFVDLVMNFTLFTLIFLDTPKEILVTKRLKRYIKSYVGWRYKLAFWICGNLLNPFDKSGNHCS